MYMLNRYDSKTKFHKNPQLATTYGQKAQIAQYVRRIDAQIAVRFCAICSIYIMPKALGDILTVSILIGGCVFYSPSYLRVNSANILHNRRLLAVSCGKLWIFVEFRLEVKPMVNAPISGIH